MLAGHGGPKVARGENVKSLGQSDEAKRNGQNVAIACHIRKIQKKLNPDLT